MFTSAFYRVVVRSWGLITFVVSLHLVAQAAGQVDAAFDATLMKVPAERAHVSRVQPDGKIITFGSFYAVNGKPSKNLVRFNPDGSTDTSFNAPFFSYSNGEVFSVREIDLQSD